MSNSSWYLPIKSAPFHHDFEDRRSANQHTIYFPVEGHENGTLMKTLIKNKIKILKIRVFIRK